MEEHKNKHTEIPTHIPLFSTHHWRTIVAFAETAYCEIPPRRDQDTISPGRTHFVAVADDSLPDPAFLIIKFKHLGAVDVDIRISSSVFPVYESDHSLSSCLAGPKHSLPKYEAEYSPEHANASYLPFQRRAREQQTLHGYLVQVP